MARVFSVNVSSEKGPKSPVSEAVLVAGRGIEGDAHAGTDRQISLLAKESVDKIEITGIRLAPGDFGENITTEGIDAASIVVGQRLAVGDGAVLQISEIGKVCATPCSIGRRLGDCIMPREGIFARVVRGGRIAAGDSVEPTDINIAAVITSSDRSASGEREDESGPLLVSLLMELGIAVSDYSVLPDEEAELTEKLIYLADRCMLDLVLTTGGTGFGPRDRMPEATAAVLESQASGISEALRHEGMRHTPFACMSRGLSGLRGRTLIINLPGSKRAIIESADLLRSILPHILEVMRAKVMDCGVIPRPAKPL